MFIQDALKTDYRWKLFRSRKVTFNSVYVKLKKYDFLNYLKQTFYCIEAYSLFMII